MSEVITVEVNRNVVSAMAFRLLMISTHYRAPLNFTAARHVECAKIWEKWVRVMEPSEEALPPEIIKALCDDLNTSLCITHMHTYAKAKQGKKLYTTMRFLGLLPTERQVKAAG